MSYIRYSNWFSKFLARIFNKFQFMGSMQVSEKKLTTIQYSFPIHSNIQKQRLPNNKCVSLSLNDHLLYKIRILTLLIFV